MQLQEALADIAEIKAALDRSQAYRGFRSTAIGVSALLVLVGGCAQLYFGVAVNPTRYLQIWVSVAAGSLLIAAAEMIYRGVASSETAVWKMHRRLAFSIAPALIAGAVITFVIAFESNPMFKLTANRNGLWLLPGVWALVYSLGLFSSSQLLHRWTRLAAAYFLIAGIAYFWLNWEQRTLQAGQMVAIFGVGQLIFAAVLYWKVERNGG